MPGSIGRMGARGTAGRGNWVGGGAAGLATLATAAGTGTPLDAARRFSSLICCTDLVFVVIEENSESIDDFAAVSMELVFTLR